MGRLTGSHSRKSEGHCDQSPVKGAVNALEKATGATLMQKGRQIEYASRALDASKQNWVESDHRPLEAIMKKPVLSPETTPEHDTGTPTL